MVTISGRLGTLLPAEGEGGGALRYTLTFSLSDGDDDGNGGDGGRGLKFELRVEGGGKDVATTMTTTTTTTTTTTRTAATGGNADYDVCNSRDDNESHGRVAWLVPSTAGAGSLNCDDCAVNSAHLFFRQNRSESYFGLSERTSRRTATTAPSTPPTSSSGRTEASRTLDSVGGRPDLHFAASKCRSATRRRRRRRRDRRGQTEALVGPIITRPPSLLADDAALRVDRGGVDAPEQRQTDNI
jgi:hypothetical protein